MKLKKTLLAAILVGASSSAFAVAPGGPNCGWGNMLFEGNSGLPMHILATIVNGTSGNATFGMTTGTNGCDTSGSLTYGGKSLLGMTGVLDEVAHDMAQGQGEALTALSVSLGIAAEDRAHFNQVMQQNFASIFTSDDVTAEQAAANIHNVMQQDVTLQQYI